jgi:hypothetical protein
MSATTDGSTVAVTKKPNAEDTVQRTTAMAGFVCACWSSGPHATAAGPPAAEASARSSGSFTDRR